MKKSYIFYFVFFFSNICLLNCLLEIPLTAIEVQGVPKYKDIEMKEAESPSLLNKFLSIFINQGVYTVNQNTLFLANMKIGSNNQEFNLLLDTGSYVLWVPRKGSSDKYELTHHYDPSTSSTSKNTGETFNIKYGSGSCTGNYYYDNVKYINNKNNNMKVGAATQTNFNVIGGDGICGLGYKYSDEGQSLIHTLKKNGITDSQIFSFKFDGEANIGVSGKMYIGKHSDFSSSSSVTAPLVTSKNLWYSRVSGFILKKGNNQINYSINLDILFDTGTNVVMLPIDYMKGIMGSLSKVGCTIFTQNNQNFQLKCTASSNSLPDFSIIINGKTLTIPFRYLYYKNGDYYYSRIQFLTSNTYILGSPFFFTYHTLFDRDNGKLHFYPHNAKSLQSNINQNLKGENSEMTINLEAIISITIVVILALIIFGYLINLYEKLRKTKEKDILSNNYSTKQELIL